MLAIFQQFGWGEIIVILFVALLLFGAKKLPEVGRGLGRGLSEFKAGMKGLADDVKTDLDDQPRPSSGAETPTRKDAAD